MLLIFLFIISVSCWDISRFSNLSFRYSPSSYFPRSFPNHVTTTPISTVVGDYLKTDTACFTAYTVSYFSSYFNTFHCPSVKSCPFRVPYLHSSSVFSGNIFICIPFSHISDHTYLVRRFSYDPQILSFTSYYDNLEISWNFTFSPLLQYTYMLTDGYSPLYVSADCLLNFRFFRDGVDYYPASLTITDYNDLIAVSFSNVSDCLFSDPIYSPTFGSHISSIPPNSPENTLFLPESSFKFWLDSLLIQATSDNFLTCPNTKTLDMSLSYCPSVNAFVPTNYSKIVTYLRPSFYYFDYGTLILTYFEHMLSRFVELIFLLIDKLFNFLNYFLGRLFLQFSTHPYFVYYSLFSLLLILYIRDLYSVLFIQFLLFSLFYTYFVGVSNYSSSSVDQEQSSISFPVPLFYNPSLYNISSCNNATSSVYYVDRNITVYVDRNISVPYNVTVFVDRNVTIVLERNVTVDRNVTVFRDRNNTVYVYLQVPQRSPRYRLRSNLTPVDKFNYIFSTQLFSLTTPPAFALTTSFLGFLIAADDFSIVSFPQINLQATQMPDLSTYESSFCNYAYSSSVFNCITIAFIGAGSYPASMTFVNPYVITTLPVIYFRIPFFPPSFSCAGNNVASSIAYNFVYSYVLQMLDVISFEVMFYIEVVSTCSPVAGARHNGIWYPIFSDVVATRSPGTPYFTSGSRLFVPFSAVPPFSIQPTGNCIGLTITLPPDSCPSQSITLFVYPYQSSLSRCGFANLIISNYFPSATQFCVVDLPTSLYPQFAFSPLTYCTYKFVFDTIITECVPDVVPQTTPSVPTTTFVSCNSVGSSTDSSCTDCCLGCTSVSSSYFCI